MASGKFRPSEGDLIRVRCVQRESEFLDLKDKWRGLLAKAYDPNTFVSWEWLCSWWQAYAMPYKLQLLLAEKGNELLGIAPLMIGSERRFGLPYRSLRFVGDLTTETDHMHFLLHADYRQETLSALLTAMDTLPWQLSFLNQMPESSESTRQVLQWAEERGYSVTDLPSPCPRRRIPESFEALIASMPPRFRTGIRSTRRKLGEKYQVEFGLHNNIEQMPEALEALYANHASRWNAKGQHGAFATPAKRKFYTLLSQRLLENGSLRFYFLKLNGKIVAQEYCFAHNGSVFLLQEGFDYSYSKENIGNALRSMVLERLIDEKAYVYDFLAGTGRHKQTWSDEILNDRRIEISRRGLYSKALHQAPLVLEALKDKVRPWLKAKPQTTEAGE